MDDHRGGSLVTGARDHRRGPRRIQIELRQLHQQSIQVTHAARGGHGCARQPVHTKAHLMAQRDGA
jgi:hypothetical protein